MKHASPVFRRFLRWMVTSLVALALMCAFFLAVIMGQPQHEEDAADSQTLPAPLEASILIADKGELGQLLTAFPAPVMAAMNTGALVFLQGECHDVPFEDGVARVVTLTYQTADGSAVTVQSIYPGRALDVLGKGDFTISGTAGHPLAGMRSIRMDSADQVRMHAQEQGALYAVTMPKAASAALRQLTSAMQLYQGE